MSGTVKHTPGPWARHDTDDYAEIHPVSGRQRSAIALVGRAEDANLIAAAPDMLEALHAAEVVLSQEGKEGSLVLMGARAAIAKAEGRP